MTTILVNSVTRFIQLVDASSVEPDVGVIDKAIIEPLSQERKHVLVWKTIIHVKDELKVYNLKQLLVD